MTIKKGVIPTIGRKKQQSNKNHEEYKWELEELNKWCKQRLYYFKQDEINIKEKVWIDKEVTCEIRSKTLVKEVEKPKVISSS